MHLPKSAVEGRPRLHRQGRDLPKFACLLCEIDMVGEPDSQACVLRGMAEVLQESAEHPCSGGVLPPVGA